MSSLPQRLGSQLLLLTRQTTSRCTSTSAFTFTSSPLTIRSRLLQTRARVQPKPPLPRRNASTTTPKPKQQPPLKPFSPARPDAILKSYIDRLASKGRTLLYEAPSHFWYRVSSFAAGTFCITYTTVQYWEVYLHPSPGLASWVPHAFGVICIFMTAMGVYFILGTQHIIRSIEAVPTRMLLKRLSPAAQSKSPIYIEVAMERPLPFLPLKKSLYAPEEIQLPFRMHGVLGNLGTPATPKPVSMVEEVRAERAAREARAKAIQFQRDHLMTAPFRDGAKVAGSVWSGIKRPFYREGFAKIKLGKAEYKFDISGGWALDEGRAMDRLFTVRPSVGGSK